MSRVDDYSQLNKASVVSAAVGPSEDNRQS